MEKSRREAEIAMIDDSSRVPPLSVVRAVLAADCASPTSALVEDGLLITPAEEWLGRRR